MIWTPLLTNLILPDYDYIADPESEIWAGFYEHDRITPAWFVFLYNNEPVISHSIAAQFKFTGKIDGILSPNYNWLNGKGTFNERMDGSGLAMFWSNRFDAWCISATIPPSGEPEEYEDDEGNIDGHKFWLAKSLPDIGGKTTFEPRGKAIYDGEQAYEVECVWDFATVETDTSIPDLFPAGKYFFPNGGTVTIGQYDEEYRLYTLRTNARSTYLFEVATWK